MSTKEKEMVRYMQVAVVDSFHCPRQTARQTDSDRPMPLLQVRLRFDGWNAQQVLKKESGAARRLRCVVMSTHIRQRLDVAWASQPNWFQITVLK